MAGIYQDNFSNLPPEETMPRSITKLSQIWMMGINIHMSEIHLWFNVNGADLLQLRHIDVMESQITSASTVFLTVCWGTYQRKYWSSASLTGGLPTQRASNTENVSIWWRHHVQASIYVMIWYITSISHHINIKHVRDISLDVVDMNAPCLWWDNYGLGGVDIT